MIRIHVDTLWLGKVGIRDKYIDEANKKNEGIVVVHKGKEMTVPFEKLKMKILFKSGQKFKDKFSNNSHYLYYMNWKEDLKKPPQEPKQNSLI